MITASCCFCGEVRLTPDEITLSLKELWFSFTCRRCHHITERSLPPKIASLLVARGGVVAIEDREPITEHEIMWFTEAMKSVDCLAVLAVR